tara:strand:+ start:825 stop:1214 length:390 start_codon:yes stop_codon:yes gene_type:complete
MSKTKVTRRTTKMPLYEGIIVVTEIVDHLENSPTINKFDVKHELEHENGWDFVSGTVIVTSDNKTHIIFRRSDMRPGVVVHECFHALTRICKDLGIKYDPDNDEPMAYMLTWLVDEVYRTIAKDEKASK